MTANIASGTLTPLYQKSAFDTIADNYDRIFTHSILGKAQRSLVHKTLHGHFREGQRILDLNCGTGEDAIHLASLGMPVFACDISERMIGVAEQKASRCETSAPIAFFVCANEHLDRLERYAPFDGVLSNFGGLNCTADLTDVARALSRLVRPGGEVFLCMLGRFCAWEVLWYAVHGQFSKAFRRMNRGGTEATIGGTILRVHYPSAREMRRAFAPWFALESRRGIGVLLPPSWMEEAFQGHPSLVGLLTQIDQWFGALPIFRGIADHVLFRFVREGK